MKVKDRRMTIGEILLKTVLHRAKMVSTISLKLQPLEVKLQVLLQRIEAPLALHLPQEQIGRRFGLYAMHVKCNTSI